jgi:hypothetical protein
LIADHLATMAILDESARNPEAELVAGLKLRFPETTRG